MAAEPFSSESLSPESLSSASLPAESLPSLLSFTLADGSFYEPPGALRPADDIAGPIRARLGLRAVVVLDGIWARVRPPGAARLPDQGWKIHISATPASAAEAAGILAAEFEASPFPFEILRDTQLVAVCGASWWPRDSAGRVAAVYPASLEECRALLARLGPALAGVAGPALLDDRRYGTAGPVHYRYGLIAGAGSVRPDGRREAVLRGPDGASWCEPGAPGSRTPPWIEELFASPQNAAKPARANAGRLTRYRIVGTPPPSAGSGVHLAEDRITGALAVLKEARPGTGFGPDGSDAADRLRREFESLTRLRDAETGIGPQPIELFEVGERLFLAEEFIEGIPLPTFAANENPLIQGSRSPDSVAEYRNRAQRVLAGVHDAVDACHTAGLALGDLSPADILVDPATLAVRLVGFGAARPLASWPDLDGAALDDIALDDVGVATVEAALLLPRPGPAPAGLAGLTGFAALAGLDGAAAVRSARHAASLLHWPLGDLFDRAGLAEHADAEPVRFDADDPAVTLALIDSGVEFILATMTPDRADLLFPADPTVFATNPFGLAHGAAGVLRALYRLTGGIPDSARWWMERNLPDFAELPPGLHVGWAGVAMGFLDTGDAGRGLRILDRVAADLDDVTTADVATGLAGIGTALLHAWTVTGAERHREAAMKVGRLLLRRAQDDGTGLFWPGSGGGAGTGIGAEGYASGSAGIATFLLHLHGAAERAEGGSEVLRIGRRALEYALRRTPGWHGGLGIEAKVVLSAGACSGPPTSTSAVESGPGRLLSRNGGIGLAGPTVTWTTESARSESTGSERSRFGCSPSEAAWTNSDFDWLRATRPRPSWSRGSAGLGAAVIRYARATGEPGLLAALDHLMPATETLAAGPGLFHGLAGLANLALDHDHLLGGDRYRDRAEALAGAILTLGVPRPEGLAFPGTGMLRFSTDFATGGAGVLLLLDRLVRRGPDFRLSLDELFDPEPGSAPAPATGGGPEPGPGPGLL